MADARLLGRLWEENVARFGHPATWRQRGDAFVINVGYAVPRDVEPAIVNALGLAPRMVTVRACDTGGRVPRPLDEIDVASESLVIGVVTPVMVAGGNLIGWRCWCGSSPTTDGRAQTKPTRGRPIIVDLELTPEELEAAFMAIDNREKGKTQATVAGRFVKGESKVRKLLEEYRKWKKGRR
jgi:hypothetical protein